MFRSRIAESYVSYIFRVLKNLHTVFYSGYTHVHSHQKCIRVPFSLYTHQYLIFVFFLMVAILTVVSHYLIAVFHLHFPVISNVRHLVSVPVGHLKVFFGKKKCLFRSPTHFLNGVVCVYVVWVVWAVNIFWIFTTYLSCPLQIIFSHSVDCLLILSMVTFVVQKTLSWIKSHLFTFAFISFAVGDPERYCYNLYQRMVLLYFSLGFLWFLVSHLDLYVLRCWCLYFEFISAHDICEFLISLFYMKLSSFLTPYWRGCLFSICIFCPLCQGSVNMAWVFFLGFLSCSIDLYACLYFTTILFWLF